MTTDTVPGLVSIVIPCYKGEPYLQAAVESCLRQTYQLLEVIVVDDASPDGCAEIADRYSRLDRRVRLVRRPENGGVSRAFNSGFETARGQFFARLAQDDEFEPTAIGRMVETLRTCGPRTGLTYCDVAHIDQAGNRLRDLVTPSPKKALFCGNDIYFCVMWTRDVWQTIGCFNPEMDAAEDFDYWVRTVERFQLAKCDGPPALLWRQHASMGTIQYSAKQEPIRINILIRAARNGRLRFDSRWTGRQVGAGFAHLELAYMLDRQGSYARAVGHVLLSFLEWPFRFPKTATRLPWIHRVRLLASLLARLLCILPAGDRGPADESC
jgi:glycosyltransferase involved in cell wall biosynthesis